VRPIRRNRAPIPVSSEEDGLRLQREVSCCKETPLAEAADFDHIETADFRAFNTEIRPMPMECDD